MPQLLHRPVVELVEQNADRQVQGAEAEERLVAEPGEYPPLGQEYCALHGHGGFISWFPRSRRYDDGAVVGGEVLVGAIDARLIAAGAGDGALELVGDLTRRSCPRSTRPCGYGRRPSRAAAGWRSPRCR